MRFSAPQVWLWICRPHARLTPLPLVTALSLLGGAGFSPASAQTQSRNATLQVIVADARGEPLPNAEVSFHGMGITALTDPAGHLRLMEVPSGAVNITVDRLGYESDSAIVRIEAGQDHVVRFALPVKPIPMEGITANAKARREQLDFLRGFHERRERGIGHFITRVEIEESGTTDLSNLLHMVPGFRTSPSQFGQSRMRSIRTPVTRQCQVKVYMDGMKYRNPTDLASISTKDIAAIEVYRGRSELPAQFADLDTNCGAVVIWTRRHSEPH